jgi:XTP/dITP diphosphohydrolase
VRIVKLILATNNAGKQRELQRLLQKLGLQIFIPGDLGLDLSVEESQDSYASNAVLKAVTFASATGLWALADDTGLEVKALSGAPGILSARLAADDEDRRHQLLLLLQDHTRPWLARFQATVALANPLGEVDLATGFCQGEIVPDERGEGGFGYDSIFLVAGTEQTMAELSLEDKNRISHRANAIRSLLPKMRQRLDLD